MSELTTSVTRLLRTLESAPVIHTIATIITAGIVISSSTSIEPIRTLLVVKWTSVHRLSN